MDLIIIIFLGIALSEAMKKHGTWKSIGGLGDCIAYGLVCLLLLALVRIPIYLLAYGFRFPFNPSEAMQLGTGIAAIVFWWAMAYWRIPMRLLGRKPGPSENPYPRIPRIDPPLS